MCIRVLTIFKCACPHRNTLVCPHHIHVRPPTADLKTPSQPLSRPTTSSSSSESPSECPSPSLENTTTSTKEDDFQRGFHTRLPSALQGHKSWTPLPGKENQRWEHCPGYIAKSRALLATTTTNGKTGGDVTMVGKETQCAEYKATEPKYRRRWEVKAGLCEECRGVHGMDGPSKEDRAKEEREKKVGAMGKGMGMGRGVGRGMGKGKEEERGRARSRAVTDPTPTVGAVSVSTPPVQVDGGNVVKGVSGKVVGKRVVRKRIATL